MTVAILIVTISHNHVKNTEDIGPMTLVYVTSNTAKIKTSIRDWQNVPYLIELYYGTNLDLNSSIFLMCQKQTCHLHIDCLMPNTEYTYQGFIEYNNINFRMPSKRFKTAQAPLLNVLPVKFYPYSTLIGSGRIHNFESTHLYYQFILFNSTFTFKSFFYSIKPHTHETYYFDFSPYMSNIQYTYYLECWELDSLFSYQSQNYSFITP